MQDPRLHQFIREFYTLSRHSNAKNLLMVVIMNNIIRRCSTFSNADMASIIVFGSSEPQLCGKALIPAMEPLCPNAFCIVECNALAYVACDAADHADALEHGAQRADGSWTGFVCFKKASIGGGHLSAQQMAVRWIASKPGNERRPVIMCGYTKCAPICTARVMKNAENMLPVRLGPTSRCMPTMYRFIRSYSPRFGDRVVTHTVVHLKKSKGVGCSRQALARLNGNGVPALRRANGLDQTVVYGTQEDFEAAQAYHGFMSELLAPATTAYVPATELLHREELPRSVHPVLASMRAIFNKTYGAMDGSIREIPLSTDGPSHRELATTAAAFERSLAYARHVSVMTAAGETDDDSERTITDVVPDDTGADGDAMDGDCESAGPSSREGVPWVVLRLSILRAVATITADGPAPSQPRHIAPHLSEAEADEMFRKGRKDIERLCLSGHLQPAEGGYALTAKGRASSATGRL